MKNKVGRPSKDWLRLQVKLARDSSKKLEREAKRLKTTKTSIIERLINKYLN